jgi:very-short-patch-repair endonuclease
LRTAWELALRLDLVEAVTYCDALAARRRFDAASLAGYLRQRSGWHGCRTAGQVFDLVDGRSESPQESRLRVHMALAGLPPPVPQYEVRVGNRFVARVDFAWPDLKVAMEYDGVWHADADQLIRDRARLNQLQAAGWYVHHVTMRDMADIARTVDAIRQMLTLRRPD